MLRSACLINSWRPADLQSAFYNIALNITQSLLDGFRLEGQLELAQGKQFELLKGLLPNHPLRLRRRGDRPHRHRRLAGATLGPARVFEAFCKTDEIDRGQQRRADDLGLRVGLQDAPNGGGDVEIGGVNNSLSTLLS
jgi:hypothetical protein